MKLKVKELGISTGGSLIVIINQHDAEKLGLHETDRIKIEKGRKLETVVIDIASNSKLIGKGEIGLFEEVRESLKVKNKNIVEISLAKKPLALDFIRKKLDGGKLTKKEIDQIVWDISNNKLSSTELTYFVSACYTNVMTMEETILLTKAIAKHGSHLKINKYPVLDKKTKYSFNTQYVLSKKKLQLYPNGKIKISYKKNIRIRIWIHGYI